MASETNVIAGEDLGAGRSRPLGVRRKGRGHGKPFDTAARIAMLHRLFIATYRTLDVDDPAQLRELLSLEDDVRSLVLHAIQDMRRNGVTWEQIGSATGTTRQAALMRWGPKL